MPSNHKKMSKAELNFYEAFMRLQENKPILLPKGTLVSQNNVAKEAGVDPSALRKSRYPELVNKIQQWIEENYQEDRPKKKHNLSASNKVAELHEKIKVLTFQRDQATSKLLEAQLKILELNNKITRMEEQ